MKKLTFDEWLPHLGYKWIKPNDYPSILPIDKDMALKMLNYYKEEAGDLLEKREGKL